jgi:hypothetical protein
MMARTLPIADRGGNQFVYAMINVADFIHPTVVNTFLTASRRLLIIALKRLRRLSRWLIRRRINRRSDECAREN